MSIPTLWDKLPNIMMQQIKNIYQLIFVLFLILPYSLVAQNLYFQHYTTDDGLSHNIVHQLYQDNLGFLWIGTEAGIARFDGLTFHTFFSQNEVWKSKVESIYQDKDNYIWIQFENGQFKNILNGQITDKKIKINLIDSLTISRKSIQQKVSTKSQKSIQIDNETVYLIDDKTKEINNLSLKLNLQSAPTFLLKDNTGNVWLATDGGGLYCIYDAPFTNYSVTNGLKNTFVHDISENKNGEIIAGTKNGLFKLKNEKWREERLNILYDNVEIWQFRQTSNKEIIFSSDLGIFRYEDYSELCIPDKNTSKTFILDKYNQVNLFYKKFFYKYPSCDEKPVRWPINDDAIRAGYCMYEDANSNLWMGTNEGAIRFKQGVSERFTVKDGLPNNQINDIKQDSIGNIWFATERGLSKLDNNGQFTNFTQEDGLLSNTCRKIGIDARGGIWIASPQGLHYFEEQNIIPYNARTGLVSNDINCLFVDSKKQLWIGTSQGISMLNIEKLPQQVQPPKVILEQINVNDQIVTLNKLANLDFDSRLSFDFTAIAFIDASKVLFQYKIAKNDIWQTTANRNVLLNNLREGKYTLQIRAKKINSSWGEILAIPFEILPPWWRTTWAIAAYLLVFMLLVYGLLLYIRNREKRKTRINKQLAELELSALQAQMNPHFIFNALNAIQNFVLNNEAVVANAYLSKFAQLMRLFLESSKSRYITIEDEIKLLKLYVDLEHLCYPNKFDYQFDIDEELMDEDYEIPTMIIQPYIENAINHGLLQKTSKGNLNVTIQLIDNQIIITVNDNGIGRKKAQQNRQKKYQSRGMSMTNDRLKVLNYIENSAIKVEVNDLFPNQEETGTQVKIYFVV
ncbi:MAG: two-component regulator propeller domain-containing protein [Saprospiraceae bacterium]